MRWLIYNCSEKNNCSEHVLNSVDGPRMLGEHASAVRAKRIAMFQVPINEMAKFIECVCNLPEQLLYQITRTIYVKWPKVINSDIINLNWFHLLELHFIWNNDQTITTMRNPVQPPLQASYVSPLRRHQLRRAPSEYLGTWRCSGSRANGKLFFFQSPMLFRLFTLGVSIICFELFN